MDPSQLTIIGEEQSKQNIISEITSLDRINSQPLQSRPERQREFEHTICELATRCNASLAGKPCEHTSYTSSHQPERRGEGESVQSGSYFGGSVTGKRVIRGNIADNSALKENIDVHQQHSVFAGDANAVAGDGKEGSFYFTNPSVAPGHVTQDGHEFRTDLNAKQGDIFQGNSNMHQGNSGQVLQGGHNFTAENKAEASGDVVQGNWFGHGKPDASKF